MKRGVPVQSQSQYFSRLFFALLSLLCCFTLLSSLENRECGGGGHLPRGRIIHCP